MGIVWYINRLRAMSIGEIFWRLEQKRLSRLEKAKFGQEHMQVTEKVFYQGTEDLRFHMEKLPIAEGAAHETYHRCISLLGGYDYETYRKNWHAGFQTENQWPLVFSYDLPYKQRDEIGDARTNWELNRHFQFALLACDYCRSGESKFLTELSELFADWNRENPFLYGISWTSVMEVAIRDINWIYTLGFLQKAQQKNREVSEMAKGLCERLRIGIINMTQYIAEHYSRYSSANNHVIVEAAAMGIAGIVMEQELWEKTAVSVLEHEIPRQNYADGVNKEVSLHYQSFFMEAVGLLMLTMERAERSIPVNWRMILQKMSRYMSDCQGQYGETVVFGDDDEGKILDLEGDIRNHYHYVLELMSVLLPERYTDKLSDRTLLELIAPMEAEKAMQKERYLCTNNVCYEEGGVSLLKSKTGDILLGIDHGELGFGSIAAHGHADALSFQMFRYGKPVFADAGTYLYHTDLENRNAFRRTQNHNTLTINGKDQSEMLGAFLWGKRAKTTLLWHNLTVGNAWKENAAKAAKNFEDEKQSDVYYLEAEHDGYAPVIHRRKFVLDKTELKIYDTLLHVKKEISYELHFVLGKEVQVCRGEKENSGLILIEMPEGGRITLQMQYFGTLQKPEETRGETLQVPEILPTWISSEYGRKQQTKQICFRGKTKSDIMAVTTIAWESQK